MPTKPKKVEGAGVAVFADGAFLSRLQSVNTDTDLGVEEVREIGNANIVEFVEGLPTVSVQLEANQWGERDNLAAITGLGMVVQNAMRNGGNGHLPITQEVFDGPAVDFVIQVEEDTKLQRSLYMGNCAITAVSWNFDVGGSATESYTLEGDNKEWFGGATADIIVVSGYYEATLTSGVHCTDHDDLTADYSDMSEWNEANGTFTPLFITKDGKKITDPGTGVALGEVLVGLDGQPDLLGGPADEAGANYVAANPDDAHWVPNGASDIAAQFTAGNRYRVVGYKNDFVDGTDVIAQGTSHASTVGGIRKGMIEIFLVSGSLHDATRITAAATHGGDGDAMLRLQTVSIDADLSREALEELSNPEAFERSLNFPISVTVNFSALASDLQTWAGFAGKRIDYEGDALTSIEFRDFVQTKGVMIKIYDDDSTNVDRNHLTTITVSGMRVASESFSVDAGGNAVQEFSCNADNFVVS